MKCDNYFRDDDDFRLFYFKFLSVSVLVSIKSVTYT